MKYQKLVNELNDILDSAAREHQRRQKKLKTFFRQFKEEEKNIRKKLKKENNKANRKKLKKELGMVKEAYAILGSV